MKVASGKTYSRSVSGFTSFLSNLIYDKVFGFGGWPEWLGGLLLGFVNVIFFVWAAKPFTIYSGFMNWGQHIYTLIGVDHFGFPKAPVLFDKTSVGDIGLLLGAFLAATLAGEFRIRFPQRKLDYLEAYIGGLLMATGVVLAVGCNWGGFFSAITALSLHGYLMFIGLLIGGFIGALYVDWRVKREAEAFDLKLNGGVNVDRRLYPGVSRKAGFLITLVLATVISLIVLANGDGELFFGILIMGIFVGIIIQRSRFCFATAFRDILRGGGEFARSARLQIGIILGLAIAVGGTAVLKYMGVVDSMAYANPSSWSNVLGGILFGIGMVIAGGCASGSLWRAAEGHVKLWVALIAAITSYPVLKTVIRSTFPWIYGPRILITEVLGWGPGLAAIYISLVIWLLSILYLIYRKGDM
jgi:hypothetical protein